MVHNLLHSRHLHGESSVQEVTSRDAKFSGRKQTRLSSLLPALQQLWMSDLHWQLPSQGSQTHRPPRPVRDSMLAELGHGYIGRKSLFLELLPRTAVEKAGLPAIWERVLERSLGLYDIFQIHLSPKVWYFYPWRSLLHPHFFFRGNSYHTAVGMSCSHILKAFRCLMLGHSGGSI